VEHTRSQNSLSLISSLVVASLLGVLLSLASSPAEAQPSSCAANQQHRQLDFWLGTWIVAYPHASTLSKSTVSLDLGTCLLIEHWVGDKGHEGMNMFAYSSDDKSWRGMFADNEGRVHMFEGTAASGSAEFHGPSRGPDGKEFINRLKIVQLNADKVEQTWEKSSDSGTTWTIEFQGEYSRVKP
jgi:hypothetical protein